MSKGKRLATAQATARKEVIRLRNLMEKENSHAAVFEIRTRLFDAEQASVKAKCLRLLARSERDSFKARRLKNLAALLTARFEAKYEVPLWD